jgi:hypothetical protein
MTQPAHTDIDVAALLAELQRRIHTSATQSGSTSALTREELRVLHEALHEVELTRVISAHWPIQGDGFVGRVVAALQKITRRLLRWYINPIVEQQNAFNDATLRAMRLMIDVFAEQTAALPPPPQTPPMPPTSDRAITAETAAQVQADRAANEPHFDMWENDLRVDEAQRAHIAKVHAHWPLPVDRPRDHLANFVHKLQRRLLQWYINPVTQHMNTCNRALHLSLVHMATYMVALRVAQPLDHIRTRHDA